jgi:hypothetical protein
MFDYIAYLMAQQRTAEGAQEALPDSPVRNDDKEPHPSRSQRPFRHGISSGLRWLADRLEPGHDCPCPTTVCRS